MKKFIFLAAAAATMFAISCKQAPEKTVDWNKIVSFTDPDGTTQEFRYDKDGNLIFDGNSTYKYNEKNQLIEISNEESSTKLVYDDKGNLISEIEDDSTSFSYAYNDKNLIVSESWTYGALYSSNTTYEYDGNKVTKTQISKFIDEVENQTLTDTSINIKYCIDPEFKYDTLEIAEEADSRKYMTKNRWQNVCGENQIAHCETYDKTDDGYKLYSLINNEFNEKGYCQKQTRINYETGDTIVTTYTAEGNKLTGSDGSVIYYLEK